MKTIWLTKGAVAFVDDSDYAELAKHGWHLQSRGYAARNIKRAGVRSYALMHRVILGASADLYVDHINGDTLDNQRANLRQCTQSQNLGNRRATKGRRYKGVSSRFGKLCPHNPFVAEVHWGDKSRVIGFFPTEEEAARAYDVAALAHFGPFAKLNFPIESAA